MLAPKKWWPLRDLSLIHILHTTIKKVGEDYERMKFNTAIAQMMTLVNQLYQKGSVTRGEMRVLIQLLNPVAPHITEEINELLGSAEELVRKPWPQYDPAALVKDTVEIALQINGCLLYTSKKP